MTGAGQEIRLRDAACLLVVELVMLGIGVVRYVLRRERAYGDEPVIETGAGEVPPSMALALARHEDSIGSDD